MGNNCGLAQNGAADPNEQDTAFDSDEEDSLESIPHTVVPSSYFGNPVPVSMSGGTAQFFSMNYTGPASGPAKEQYGKSATYWLGKDVERALDELPFYEDLLKLDLRRYKLLQDWTMSYVGILTARVARQKNTPGDLEEDNRHLLVIHDISDGLNCKRMLDVKIGEETAVGGWKGKSHRSAKMQSVVDRHTNSTKEGYRLEGFDNQPESLLSQDQGDSANLLSRCGAKWKKKNARVQLQRQPLRDFCRYWNDMNDMEDMFESNSTLTVAENSEAILFDAVRQMAQMCVDARNMPVAQMWIGSSLCLACDSGTLLPRLAALQRLARARPEGPSMQAADLAKVCVFDWGRSQLNTLELNQALSSDEQLSRKRYWDIWVRGILRALFEIIALYLNQFCHSKDTMTIEAWDFDSFDANDLLGTVELPLQPSDGPEEVELSDCSGSVTVEVTEMPVPSPSRLQKIYRVYVYGVSGLPRADVLTDTDPLVRVKVGSEEGHCAVADTPVQWDDRNADIEHPLYFGRASAETKQAFFMGLSAQLGVNLNPSLFDFAGSDQSGESVRRAKFEAFLQSVPLFNELARNAEGSAFEGM